MKYMFNISLLIILISLSTIVHSKNESPKNNSFDIGPIPEIPFPGNGCGSNPDIAELCINEPELISTTERFRKGKYVDDFGNTVTYSFTLEIKEYFDGYKSTYKLKMKDETVSFTCYIDCSNATTLRATAASQAEQYTLNQRSAAIASMGANSAAGIEDWLGVIGDFIDLSGTHDTFTITFEVKDSNGDLIAILSVKVFPKAGNIRFSIHVNAIEFVTVVTITDADGNSSDVSIFERESNVNLGWFRDYFLFKTYTCITGYTRISDQASFTPQRICGWK